jgi:death-on-curing protein
MERLFLTLDEVLEIHDQQIERYGGSPGLRDAGGLESGVATPQAPGPVTLYPTLGGVIVVHARMIARIRSGQTRSGYSSDLIQEAAARCESLSQNHLFIDGNNRVAVTRTAFLKVNGYRLELDDEKTFSFLSGFYETGTMRFEQLDGWLRVMPSPADPQA